MISLNYPLNPYRGGKPLIHIEFKLAVSLKQTFFVAKTVLCDNSFFCQGFKIWAALSPAKQNSWLYILIKQRRVQSVSNKFTSSV